MSLKFTFPFSGTDADAASRILNETNNFQETGSLPTINKLYQMLHTNSDLHKQSKLGENFNYSSVNLTHSFLYNNLKYPTSVDKNNVECCLNVDQVGESNASVSNEDAKVMVEKVKENMTDNKKNRKRRVVNVVRTFIEVTTSDTRRYIEATAMSLLSSHSPSIMERRRKLGEAGSSAPLLNYIFDTYSNIHQHRNEK